MRQGMRAIGSLGLEVVLRQTPQFLIDHGRHLTERVLVPLDPRLQQAHELLQHHGQMLCKRSKPACDSCPLAACCQYV